MIRDEEVLERRVIATLRAKAAQVPAAEAGPFGPTPRPEPEPRHSRGARVLVAAVVVVVLVVGAIGLVAALTAGDDPGPAGEGTTGLPAARFVPPTTDVGGRTVMSLTLANGDTLDLEYPSDLALQELGFEPSAQITWMPRGAGVDCCGRIPEITRGTVEQVFVGRTPAATYRGPNGEAVPYFTGRDVNHLAFQIGGWVVAVPDYEGTTLEPSNPAMTDAERTELAASLTGYETDDGFLVLTPRAPLVLSRAKADATFGAGTVIVLYRPCDEDGSDEPVGAHGFTREAAPPETGTWLCMGRIPLVVHVTGSDEFQRRVADGLAIPRNHQSNYG